MLRQLIIVFLIVAFVAMGSPIKQEGEGSEQHLVKREQACEYVESFCAGPTLWCRYRCYDCGSDGCSNVFVYRDIPCGRCS